MSAQEFESAAIVGSRQRARRRHRVRRHHRIGPDHRPGAARDGGDRRLCVAIDLAREGRGSPGNLTVAALTVLVVVGVAATWLVVGFDTHFDGGGALGGLGESTSARSDESCVAAREWRTLAASLAIVGSGVLAGVRLRRRGRTPMGARRPVTRAATVVSSCVALWTVVVLVVG